VLKHCTSDTFKRLAHGYIGGIELFGGVGAVLTEIEKAAISSNIEMELECAPSNLLPKNGLALETCAIVRSTDFSFHDISRNNTTL